MGVVKPATRFRYRPGYSSKEYRRVITESGTNFMNRVLCPRHKEDTPSCVVYETHAYCFGCAALIPLQEINSGLTHQVPFERSVEDILESISHIDTLPRNPVRGLRLPSSSLGYYVIWPCKTYYKCRRWGDVEPKYRNPSGHKYVPFWATKERSQTLYLVEGEINALSLKEAISDDICSPGAASNFVPEQLSKLLTEIQKYSRVVLVVDKDPAGVLAAIAAKGYLGPKIPQVYIKLMEKDCNQVLVEDGKEKLKEVISENWM